MSTPKIKPYLTTHSLHPEIQETPIEVVETDIIDKRIFYLRNHFSFPSLIHSNYWLPINGLVTTPLLLSMNDILGLPAKSINMILECSGNKRSFFEPKVFGDQWKKGAINQGVWKGVPLRTLLELAGMQDGAKEVVVEGHDFGEKPDLDQVYAFARSLPIEKALNPDTIIAFEYNHEPIPFKHGFPLRLIVPQWYAMASVKWIKQITVIGSHFSGPFQSIDYVYYPHKENDNDAFPVTLINVNSTIQKPLDRQILNLGKHVIKGIALSGEGYITMVEISTDHGKTWYEAKIHSRKASYEWVTWSFDWTVLEQGEYTIMSKATDSHGRVQREEAFWNRKGYGYNAMDRVKVKVE